MSNKHYVLLYGRHGTKKQCELFYYEDHIWDRIGDRCPNISELELNNIEQTGSTCLKNDAIHTVEIVTCDCQFPNLHLGVNTCQN